MKFVQWYRKQSRTLPWLVLTLFKASKQQLWHIM